MTPREDEVRRLVSDWVRKAELDFDVAVRLAAEGGRFREVVAFHSQQAAEKYLKGLLVRYQVEFPKTHDIKRLLEIVRSIDPETSDCLAEASWLGPFGVDIRYPGDFPDTTPGDELRAVQLARLVRDIVMAKIAPYLAERE